MNYTITYENKTEDIQTPFNIKGFSVTDDTSVILYAQMSGNKLETITSETGVIWEQLSLFDIGG